jgi:colanic acid biosynthesis glycosyl transferase WcaI
MLLVHLTDNELFSITIPSRTQAYMRIGKPIVMGVNGNNAADLIELANAGVTCKANNASSLADAMITIINKSSTELEAMGDNEFDYYQQELSLVLGFKKFISVFEEVKR